MRRLLCVLGSLCVLSATAASAQSGQATPPAPTFNKDVAPICCQLHLVPPGRRIAPMSLLTYKEARPWAKGIKAQVVRPRDAAVVCGPEAREVQERTRG